MRHLLDIDDLTNDELQSVLARSVDPAPSRVLANKGVALVFEKPSARTRNSMEMAVHQLGGHPVYIQGTEVGLDVRETVEDVGRTLSCFHSMIAARVFDHSTVERLASLEVAPIVNLLSDRSHPMQGLADVLTIAELSGWSGGPVDLSGVVVAYVGDANNVTRSLALAAGRLGAEVRIAVPNGYEFDDAELAALKAAGGEIALQHDDPALVVDGANVVYTDVWTSMGEEDEAAQRQQDFAGYTIDSNLMAKAKPDAMLLHCLPAHRGEEVSVEVLEGPQSRVWRQAENRMHVARGLLWWLMESS